MSDDSGLLTRAVTTWPPPVTHVIARLLGFTAALRMLCPCGTCGTQEGDDDD